MAGEDLLASLLANSYTGGETGWGIAAQGVSSALPALVDPYGSPGRNFATVLGGALVAGLLGYQARQAADERNAASASYLTELLSPTITPERRSQILQAEPRLAGASRYMAINQMQQQLEDEKLRRQEGIKAEIESKRKAAEDLGVSISEYDTMRAAGTAAAQEAGTSSEFLGTKAEGELKSIQDNLTKSDAYKNYQYSKGVVQRLAQGVMKTDAVSDVEFAKGAIQAIEPALAVNEGEVRAIMGSPSIPEQFKALMANAAEGKGKLSPQIRAQILGIARNAYNSYANQYQQVINFAENEALTRTRRADRADVIRQRISPLGPAQTYEDVVQKWFRVPGVEDLGDASASQILDKLASGELSPERIISALSSQQQPPAAAPSAQSAQMQQAAMSPTPQPTKQKEVIPLVSATPESKLVKAMTPTATATPAAVVGATAAPAPTTQTVVVPVAQPTAAPAATAQPAAAALAVAEAKLRIKALQQVGRKNWSDAQEREYAALYQLVR